MIKPSRALGWIIVFTLALAGSAAAAPGRGKLSGIVLDVSGTPQMGASVWLVSEDIDNRTTSLLLTNQHGAFASEALKPGKYSIRVTLAGFLPAWERQIAVAADLTTLVRVRIDSMFASLDTLRRNPDTQTEPDDWKWVLRSSPATRTVLQWRDGSGQVDNTELASAWRPRGRVELTSGTLRPGSPSSLTDSPATTMSYDQTIGAIGRILIAGQMSYDRSPSGAFASVWLPSGANGRGPETVFVMRQGKIGVDSLTFQGIRLDHTEQFALGDRVVLRAGAEFLRAGITKSITTLNPHAQVTVKLAPTWEADFVVASSPSQIRSRQDSTLQSAIGELDSLPTVLFREGGPVLEGRRHQQVSVSHQLAGGATLAVAAFHDSTRHQGVFGKGAASSADFLQDAFSSAFLYDGGSSSSWGTRVAYRQKVWDDLEVAALYSWAGALTPTGDLDRTTADLRDSFATRHHHSVAARVSGKLPGVGTQVTGSYQWTSGITLTRQDNFSDVAFQVDPSLSLSIHQPLPGFGWRGRWEALADFRNMLAEGYVPVNGPTSQVVLVPVLRSFRGGVSFQF